ncbi:MAG: hypothetical protein ING75_05505 [Rhodocyclaceae bacterium]|nr:hypothetical protein [Rhodocyclaceae bacterium]
MNFKYRLQEPWISKVSAMEEFANGATQATIKLKEGRVFHKALISDATYLIAMRGFDDLPFDLIDIDEITQGPGDKNPSERGGWKYWDDWK